MLSHFALVIIVSYSCNISEAISQFKLKQQLSASPYYQVNPYTITDERYSQLLNESLHNKKRVCALKYVDPNNTTYILSTFESDQLALSNGYTITHQGKCGVCSTLQDLSVYLSMDLTHPVRKCGLEGILNSDSNYECLLRLGFTNQCAQIWLYNTLNTRKKCFTKCIWSYITNEKFVDKNGKLNSCLQCDEDLSGPVFKYESGRTRRNSGITSEIDRPNEEIYNLTHCYY